MYWTGNSTASSMDGVAAGQAMRMEAIRHDDLQQDALREAMIAAAVAQIARNGVRGMSLRKVAAASGVSHTGIYRYFKSRDSLLAAIAEQGFRRLGAALRQARDQADACPLAVLQATAVAYVDFGVTHSQHLQVMFGNHVQILSDTYPSMRDAALAAFEVLGTTIQRGQQDGQLNTRGGGVVTLAAWSVVHGLAILLAYGHTGPGGPQANNHKELAFEVSRLMIEGLAAPG